MSSQSTPDATSSASIDISSSSQPVSTPASTPVSTSDTATATPTTPTTSASPTTTPEPTTTPTSAPVTTQPVITSSDQIPSTSAGGFTSVPSASSAAVTSAARPSSTVVQTTFVSSSNGVAVTTIYTTTITVASASSSATTTNTPNSHIGAIVGGVVGGLAALGLIGLIVFCLLRRRHNEDDFDGNFDPDRVVGHSSGGGTLPQIDLGAEVTPYAYGPHNNVGQPAMAQYNHGDSPYTAMRPMSPPHSMPSQYTRPPSDYNQTSYNQAPGPGPASDTSGSHYGSSVGAYGVPAGAALAPWPQGARSPSPTNTSSTTPSQPRSAKEREALAARYGRQGGLGLSTQHEEPGYDEVAPGAGAGTRAGAGTSGGEGVVHVHQDGGRVRDGDEGPTEIPPTYDSIPADERAP